jgi:hypothetical protein
MVYFLLGMKVRSVLVVCPVFTIAAYTSMSDLKVHKIENFLVPFLNFVLFQF